MDSRNFHLIEALEPRIVLAAGLTPLEALKAELAGFVADKTTPPATMATVTDSTLITAKADDLVYAVYQVTLDPTYGFDTASEIADVVGTALKAQAGKARADKDKIAPRILSAALIGSGLSNDSSAVSAIVTALANVNAGDAKTALTVAGKEAVIGQALMLTSGKSAAVGIAIADVAKTLSSAVPGATLSPEAKLQTFAIAAIKAAGVGTGEIRSFTGELLATGVSPFNQQAFALKVAEGVVKNPTAAGEVIGGAAAQLNEEGFIQKFALAALSDTKLKGAIAAIVAGTASATPVGSESDFARALVTKLGIKATTAVRASIASGAIQAINQTSSGVTVSDVINRVLEPGEKVLTKAELATFAGGAAVGTGDAADDVVTKISALAPESLGANATTLTAVGVAVLKAIATSSPSAGKAIAQALIDANPTIFPADTVTLTNLAKNLSKGVPTSGPTAGAAVAGVATKLNGGNPTADHLATFGAAVIPVASKSTLNISKELSALLATTNYKEFAALLVSKLGITVATAPNVAAGVAVTAGLGNLDPTLNQTPGDIAVAVAKARDSKGILSYQSKLATIAGAVALAVDPERIALIGGKVAAQYQLTGSTSTLPKLSAIGTLATSLAKAINTKPLTGTANRVDELGEVAAELTRAAITTLGPNATAAQLASTIGSIGSAVVKGLSAALLINGGAFGADLKDSARDLAGAIAQTISVIGIDAGVISAANVDSLLSDTGTLATSLAKAAKKFGAEVNGTSITLPGAFGEVRLAMPSSDRLVPGNEPLGVGEVSPGTSGVNGKYEIGSLIDPETPITSLP